MTKDELKPIDTGKYKITETGQVLKMTKEECEIETSKAIMEMRTHIAELEKENAELKEKLEVSEQLRDYWKSSFFDWRHKCTRRKSFKVAVKAQKQLTKAKEIIKDYMTIVKGTHITICSVSEENRTINVLKLNEEAEQFLNKEVIYGIF